MPLDLLSALSPHAIDPRDLPRVQAFWDVPPGVTHPDPWVALRTVEGGWRVMERTPDGPVIHNTGGPCPELFDADTARERLALQELTEDDGLWQLDVAAGKLRLTARSADLLGLPLENGTTSLTALNSLLSHEDTERLALGLKRVNDGGFNQFAVEVCINSSHKNRRRVRITGHILNRKDGLLAGRIRLAEIRYTGDSVHNAVFSGSPDIVTIFSLDGEHLDLLATGSYNWTPDQARGVKDFVFLHPDDRPAADALFRKIVSRECESGNLHLRIQDINNGSWIWFSATARIVRLPDGRDVVVAHHWDIDQIKREEADIRRQRDDLDRIVAERTADLTAINERLRAEVDQHQATQALARKREEQLVQAYNQATMGRLASMVAHQVNAPLAAVHDLVGETLAAVADRPNAVTKLGLVGSELERLSRTIRNLLTYTRQRLALRTPVAVAEVIRTVAALFQPTFSKRGVTLHVTLADDLPVLEGDADLFQEVLVNLLENARDALSHGQSIWVNATCSPTYVHITVADDGVGLGADPERLFEPFFTTKATGTGLGLPIVRQVCEGYGGSVSAANRSPQGAEFRVVLPRKDLP